MDTSSFELLHRAVEGQLKQLRGVLADLAGDQRGSTYVRFIDQHLAALEALTSTTAAAFPSAIPIAQFAYANKLLRIRYLLTLLHRDIFDHKDDVGRNDLPSGLLYLVDHLIDDLLKASGDPVIHLDPMYMYSTQRLVDRWEGLSGELKVKWTETAEPIVFNLPGLDPGNALLSPILAHEVGHAVIRRTDLVSDLGSRLPTNEVDDLKAQLAVADPSVDVDEALAQFALWAEEMLCDALAAELTGPSFLFSSAVFLPASLAGRAFDEHPDPAQRIKLTLLQLDLNGWTSPLSLSCPNVMAWLQAVAVTPAQFPSAPREVFLRGLVDVALPEMRAIAHDYVSAPLDWSTYGPLEGQLTPLLDAGVPPAELAGDPLSPWAVIASVWLNAIALHGDSASGLVAAVDDDKLSRFSLKTIEMSRVLQLWRDEHAVAP